MQSDNFLGRVAHSIAGAAARTDTSKNAIYNLINAGRLRAKKLGKRTIIQDEALRDCVAELPDYELPEKEGR